MMQNPLDLTQTDLQGLMEAGQTLANIPGVGGGSSPLGGVGELLETLQKGLNMFDQFQGSVEKFGTTIAKLRSAEGLGIDPPAQGGFFPSGQIIDGGVYQPPERTVNSPRPPLAAGVATPSRNQHAQNGAIPGKDYHTGPTAPF